jgi:hypothetical protein
MFEDNSIDDSLHVSMKKEYLSISYLKLPTYVTAAHHWYVHN